jgi:hypothetical protein
MTDCEIGSNVLLLQKLLKSFEFHFKNIMQLKCISPSPADPYASPLSVSANDVLMVQKKEASPNITCISRLLIYEMQRVRSYMWPFGEWSRTLATGITPLSQTDPRWPASHLACVALHFSPSIDLP